MTTRSPASLTVTAGLHQGAKVELVLDRLLLVGSDPNCDVVLADPGLAPQQLALLAQAGSLTLRALAAGIQVDGQPLASGTSIALPQSAGLGLPGGVTLQLKRRRQVTQASRYRWRSAATIMAGMLLVSGLTAIAALDAPPAAGGPGKQRTPAQVLQRLGLSEQVQLRAAGNGWYLSGVVANEAMLDRLRRDIGELEAPTTLAVTTAPQLITEVSALLRLKGISAAPRYIGQGIVATEGSQLPPALRQTLAATARRDIRGLSELRFDGPQPAPAESPTPQLGNAGSPIDADAKRVVSVVEGPESYVVTADGGRYFEGAWLPSGHRVERIADGKVWLAQGKHRVELVF